MRRVRAGAQHAVPLLSGLYLENFAVFKPQGGELPALDVARIVRDQPFFALVVPYAILSVP
jgi:hypothetical protein